MKLKLLIVFVAFAGSLVACTKNTPSNTDKVFIRIENATSENFSNFTFNRVDFNGIASGDTSTYLLFKNVLPHPFANEIAINNRYIYIMDMGGVVYLQNGRYLVKVVSDTLSLYQASFIRE